MGKIFSALEKYRKEREASIPAGKLRSTDWKVLLKCDSSTGKLDIKNPAIAKEKRVLRRLQFYSLIQADGTLTPAGLAKYAELEERTKASTDSEPSATPLEKSEGGEREPVPEEFDDADIAVEESEAFDAQAKISAEKLRDLDRAILLKDDIRTDNVSSEPAPNSTRIQKTLAKRIIPSHETFLRASNGLQQAQVVTPVTDKSTGKVTGTDGDLIKMHKSPTPAEHNKPSEDKHPGAGSPLLYDKNAIDNKLVSLLKSQSFEAEQFKILRANLLYPISGKAPRSVLVTSTAPGEGKSLIAANLAISIASEINKYVLLIDCDLRQPTIHSVFGFGDAPGLSDYLCSNTPLQSLLLRTPLKKLSILSSGKPPSNPSELLSSKQMSALLDEVTARYSDRIIIIDSPPPKLTAEARVLANQVDGVLVVVKCGSTKKEQVKELIDKIGSIKILGAVMNDFDIHSFGYRTKYYEKNYGKHGSL